MYTREQTSNYDMVIVESMLALNVPGQEQEAIIIPHCIDLNFRGAVAVS
jgi:hypothetical protein